MKRLLSSLFVMLMSQQAIADFTKINSKINTQIDRPEAQVKQLEKSKMFHCGYLLNKRLNNLVVSIDKNKGEVKLEFDYPSLEWYSNAARSPNVRIDVAPKI